jgi:hypothetical protein
MISLRSPQEQVDRANQKISVVMHEGGERGEVGID